MLRKWKRIIDFDLKREVHLFSWSFYANVAFGLFHASIYYPFDVSLVFCPFYHSSVCINLYPRLAFCLFAIFCRHDHLHTDSFVSDLKGMCSVVRLPFGRSCFVRHPRGIETLVNALQSLHLLFSFLSLKVIHRSRLSLLDWIRSLNISHFSLSFQFVFIFPQMSMKTSSSHLFDSHTLSCLTIAQDKIFLCFVEVLMQSCWQLKTMSSVSRLTWK